MEEISQEKVWDLIAKYWNKYKSESFGSKDGLIDRFILSKDKVLDLGCGSGRNFISKGHFYGIDFSLEMLNFAKKNALKKKIKTELKKANLWKTGYEDNFFDKVICIAALHCVKSKLNRKKTIKEIYRVLKPKGKAIITVWNKDSKRWKNKSKEITASWTLESDDDKKNIKEKKVLRYYYLYSLDELKKVLESTGFKIIRHSYEDARNIVIIVEKSV